MKATRKLIPAIAMLLVAAAVMSTASYAWFTMSKQVTATGMNVTVTAPSNLVIATEFSGPYAASANLEVLDHTYYVVPASSVDGETFFVLDSTSAVDGAGKRLIDSKYVTGEKAVAATTPGTITSATIGAYVDFKYYIKTDGGAPVKLYVKSVKLGQENAKDAGKNAIRFAILDGFTSINETGTARTTINDNNVYTGAGTYAVPGKAIKTIQTNGTVTEDDLAAVEAFTVGSTELFTVIPGAISVITIRVWLEGEDESCTVGNAASMKFNLEVVFADIDTVAPETEPAETEEP